MTTTDANPTPEVGQVWADRDERTTHAEFEIVAFERRPTIAPMCAIGRDYQTAIGTGQGSTMGGTALTGVLTPASAGRSGGTLRASGGTLLTTSGAVGAPAAPKSGGRTGPKPSPSRRLE